MIKRIFSAICALMLIIGLLPAAVNGAETEYEAGDIGDAVAASELSEEEFSEFEPDYTPFAESELAESAPAAQVKSGTAPSFTFEIKDNYAVLTGADNVAGSVTIPDTYNGYPVKSIDFNAFYRCTELTEVVIPDSVQFVGIQAFYGCTSLQSVRLSQNLTRIYASAFLGCSALTQINLPDTLEEIDERAFQWTALQTLRIPKNLKAIGPYAFAGIPIEEITVADGCLNYKAEDNILFSKDGTELVLYPITKAALEYTVPAGVKKIGDSAFVANENLTKIVLPNGLEEIGDGAFNYCLALAEMDIPTGVTRIGSGAFGYMPITHLTIPDSVIHMGDSVASYCDQLISVDLGSGLLYIADWSFYECSKLSQVNFSENSHINILWDFVFQNCDTLESIAIPEGVTMIRNGCFNGCGALKQVTLPSTLERITYGAFFNCGLENVTLPDGLLSINRLAFAGNTQLTEINIPESVTFIYRDAFTNTGIDLKTVVHSGLVLDMSGHYYAGAQVELDGKFHYDYANQVLKLVNQERAANGMSALTLDATLTDEAMQRAAEIAVYFSHDRPLGSSVLNSINHAYGENIAAGQGSPESVMQSWMNSAGHRENILRDWMSYTRTDGIGIGCFYLNGAYYWVQLFGVNSGSNAQKTGVIDTKATVMIYTDAMLEDTSYTPDEKDDFLAGKDHFTPYYQFNLSQDSLYMTTGSSAKLETTLIGADSSSYTGQTALRLYAPSIVWSSTNTGVAAANGGNVRAVGTGNTAVTAALGTLQATCQVWSCPFVDVPSNQYYYRPVLWAVENGITAGKDQTHFAPNDACTRGQIVAFLWRASGRPEPQGSECPFTDVSAEDYYYTAVLWAVENGITAGATQTTFAPDADCTRAQIVSFLWRAAGRPDTDGGNPFVDVADNAYYGTAVRWAAANGIVYGITQTQFAPNSSCTRGQVVSFLYRALA